ncbi:hypothetical protein AAU57_09190 [Nonlabens sp. YIK11]|uniref:DinB family protein n=1 Tax=Nonlabens sp. YIK11 TaxID=1453349 RepID=UPI0007078EB8|nr:DinB family protein [Nonlabens sp. YIK11]KQC33468.1 hypothetical protein AAU57_09190 [Nonlabens sp. YIK11]
MIFRRDIRPSEYAAYYEPYINSISLSSDMLFMLKETLRETIKFIDNLEKPLDHRYAPDKWSIGELLVHCMDTERIFGYRALSFMRGDATNLPGFDQDLYVRGLRDFAFAKANLISSLEIVRASTIDLFENATPESLNNLGVGSGHSMSVRAIPFVICGHWKHHLKIIENRY